MTKDQMLTLINSIEIGAILCAQELIENDLITQLQEFCKYCNLQYSKPLINSFSL